MKIEISGMFIFMIVFVTVAVIANNNYGIESKVNERCFYVNIANLEYPKTVESKYCQKVESQFYFYLKAITNTSGSDVEDIQNRYNDFMRAVQNLEHNLDVKVQRLEVEYNDRGTIYFQMKMIINPTNLTKNTKTIILGLTPFLFQFINDTDFKNDTILQCNHKYENISESLLKIPYGGGYRNPVCCDLISTQLADFIVSVKFNYSVEKNAAKYQNVLNRVELMRKINSNFLELGQVKYDVSPTQRIIEIKFILRFQSGIAPNCRMETIVEETIMSMTTYSY